MFGEAFQRDADARPHSGRNILRFLLAGRGIPLPLFLCGLSLVPLAMLVGTPASAGGMVTDCSSYGPGAGTLSQALAGGGSVTFACDGTIIVPEILISQDTVIDASGRSVVLSGNGSNGVFRISVAALELINLTVTDGWGGAIDSSGTLTLRNSSVSANTAPAGNGVSAISISAGTGSIINSKVSGNSGGVGPILNVGALTILNSAVSDNSGEFAGGIANYGTLWLTNSTLFGNSNSGFGGGIVNMDQATASLTNCTLSGNSAGQYGGGIQNQGSMTIDNCTLSGNTSLSSRGNGINNQNDTGRLTLRNTIIADQAAGTDCAVAFGGTIMSSGYNVDSDGSCNLSEATDLPAVDPLLGPLQDNGGPTLTHSLLPGSPAIDAIPVGTSGCGTTLVTDQRGVERPQGPACDLGAFELAAQTTPTCVFYTKGYKRRACDGTTWVTTLAQLEAYENSDYGLHDGKYRNLGIASSLGNAEQDLDIHSPCSVTVGGSVALTGRSINVDGRKGVLMNWGSQLDANGRVCILSQQSQTELKGDHRIDANDLTLMARSRARIGPVSQVYVAGPLLIKSLSNSNSGRAEIRNDATVSAASLFMQGPYLAAIGNRTSVNVTGDAAILSQDVADSLSVLRYQSQVQAGGALVLASGGSARIASKVLVNTPDTLTMNANSPADCTVAATASISYGTKAGNCADKLP